MSNTNMKWVQTRSILTLAYVTVTAIVLCYSGCGPQMLASRQVDRAFTIDGADTEWGNFIQYYDDVTRTSFCFFNDEDYFFIKMSTTNPVTVRSLRVLGLTVWFGYKENDTRRWGIVYPLPLKKRNRVEKLAIDRPDSLETDTPLTDLILLAPEYADTLTTTIPGLIQYNIEISMQDSTPELVYELKVPMRKNEGAPYAALATDDTEIGIGFRTGDIESDEIRQLMRLDNMNTTDMAKEIGENSMRNRRTSRPRGFGHTPDPIDVWLNILPASKQEE